MAVHGGEDPRATAIRYLRGFGLGKSVSVLDTDRSTEDSSWHADPGRRCAADAAPLCPGLICGCPFGAKEMVHFPDEPVRAWYRPSGPLVPEGTAGAGGAFVGAGRRSLTHGWRPTTGADEGTGAFVGEVRGSEWQETRRDTVLLCHPANPTTD